MSPPYRGEARETSASASLLMSGRLELLAGSACVVIISAGIMAASHLVSLILLSLFFGYGLLPLPRWMMHRFKFSRELALALTVGLLGVLSVVLIFLLYERAVLLREKLPIYQERVEDLYAHLAVFLNAHSIDITKYSVAKFSTSDQIFKYAQLILPQAGRLFSDGLLILMLGSIFLITMAEDAGPKRGRLATHLVYYGSDVQTYIGISATTGVLTALANLALLVAFGVDFPLVWCVLYFFLHFIPNIGFILALIPPSFLALLMLGWKEALLVAGGLILTNTISDYVLTPLFMKKDVHVSFLEMMMSLLWWGFLLGPPGGILAIPLTLALRKLIAGFAAEPKPAYAEPG